MKPGTIPNPDNLAFIEQLFIQYLQDPSTVDPQWHDYLEAMKREENVVRGPYARTDVQPPSIFGATQSAQGMDLEEAERFGQVWRLVNAYRVRGHMLAKLDPIERQVPEEHPELGPAYYGLPKSWLDKMVPNGSMYGAPAQLKLSDLLERLKTTYSKSIGVEFMNINDMEQKLWLQEQMELCQNQVALDKEKAASILYALIKAEGLEQFIHTKYPGTKRFSLEGGEGVVPLLKSILDESSQTEVEEVVVGMAHRGRLNVLVNVMGKSLEQLFEEFEDPDPMSTLGGGDVKYHLGYSSEWTAPNGKELHLSLSFNPSHLEAVNPVVEGRVRAKQDRRKDRHHKTVLPLLIHGDAAFSGQGLVPETLNLAELTGYRTGGTIHIIINNHIGFTTAPSSSRSTHYSTDVARMMQIPIFHVNGEDPDALVQVAKLAVAFRTKFQRDVVIDMHCYRKYGHNEMDEPRFTQPLVYDRISKHPSPIKTYTQNLVAKGMLTEAEVEAKTAAIRENMEKALAHAKGNGKSRRPVDSLKGLWSNYCGGKDQDTPEVPTGVSKEILTDVTEKLTHIPEGFQPHRKAQRLLERRAKMFADGMHLDWAMGELLAYGTLVREGHPLRMTGQDSRRGTFSHRHAVLTDTANEAEWIPGAHISDDQAFFHIFDSSLSEVGVLGFEYGYSLDYPDALVIWEAQFGDFANGAQVIIDQFITSSEDKWQRMSGLTMFLPHGYEGQGPEHSSARLERYLQACAEDNIQVAYPSTPANVFHMLRRQVHRPIRKPLIVMTPKSLLRHPLATSSIEEFTEGGFQKVIDDGSVKDPSQVERLLLCTGKIYYELAQMRDLLGRSSNAIARVELLYPFPEKDLQALLDKYTNLKEIVWVQEEPWQMGAWHFIWTRSQSLFKNHSLSVCSRKESASPATGSHKAHLIEACLLMEDVFGGDIRPQAQAFYKVQF